MRQTPPEKTSELTLNELNSFLSSIINSKKIILRNDDPSMSIPLDAQDIVELQNLQEKLKNNPSKTGENLLEDLNQTYKKLSSYSQFADQLPDLKKLPTDDLKQMMAVNPAAPQGKETKTSLHEAWEGLKNIVKGSLSLTANAGLTILKGLRDTAVFASLAVERSSIDRMKDQLERNPTGLNSDQLAIRARDLDRKTAAHETALTRHGHQTMDTFNSLKAAVQGGMKAVTGLTQLCIVSLKVAKNFAQDTIGSATRHVRGQYERYKMYKAEMEKVKAAEADKALPSSESKGIELIESPRQDKSTQAQSKQKETADLNTSPPKVR